MPLKIESEKINLLLESLYTLTDMTIGFYDENYNCIESYPLYSNRSRFCACIDKFSEFKQKCDECDKKYLLQAKKTKKPVISVITTTVPSDRCLKELWVSSTDLFRPKIISFPDENAWKRLNSMLDKAKKQEEFGDVEGLELINLPRCCTKDHEKAIELICEELLNLNIEDSYVKNELIYAMQCMIHKYARTDEDILRLEGMIELRQVIDKRSPVLDAMKYEGRKEGIEIGREEERNDTLKVLCDLVKSSPVDSTMEKVIGSLGFSMDEVMNADID